MNLEQEIENMELELAKKKVALTQMQGADKPQDGNISTANPETGNVDYEKMQAMKKKMFMAKYSE